MSAIRVGASGGHRKILATNGTNPTNLGALSVQTHRPNQPAGAFREVRGSILFAAGGPMLTNWSFTWLPVRREAGEE